MPAPRPHPLTRDPPASIFAAWLRERQATGRPLSARTASLYELIWTLWCQHLQTNHSSWHAATPSEMASFVSSRPTRSPRMRDPSTVTMTRYWRVLQRIYDTLPLICLRRGLPPMAHPLASVDAPPEARTETTDATFVPAPTLRLLRRSLRDPLPDPTQDDVRQPWAYVRDRALLAVLLDTAMTVSELAALQVTDLLPCPTPRLIPTPTQVTARHGPAHSLRTLPLSRETSSWLTGWLHMRQQLNCPDATLFVSAKGRTALTPVSVWRSIASAVRLVLARAGMQLPYHFGPGMLRNSVLLTWMEVERRPIEDVSRLAGFKTPRSLQRLMSQASATVRQHYADALANPAEEPAASAQALLSPTAPPGAARPRTARYAP